jgi:hypothetical protein
MYFLRLKDYLFDGKEREVKEKEGLNWFKRTTHSPRNNTSNQFLSCTFPDRLFYR